MALELGAIVEAVAKDLNKNYKTIGELAKEMGYPTPAYVSKKAKSLKLGLRIKTVVLLSPEEQELLKSKINRKEKEELEEVN